MNPANPNERDESDLLWERAYERFETPGEEVRKFGKRLRRLGADRWDRNLRVCELFCGRGSALHAWEGLGFSRLCGLDRSPRLLERYEGRARLVVGDARRLPFAESTWDVVSVQGGLHHLPGIEDVERCLAEIRRVLAPRGHLVVVEPWRTPYLGLAHLACASGLVRRLSKRVDALAEMIHHERTTYERWLANPDGIRRLFSRYLDPQLVQLRRGKLMMVAGRRDAVGAPTVPAHVNPFA